MYSKFKELMKSFYWYEYLVFALLIIVMTVTYSLYFLKLDEFDRMIFRSINSAIILKWLLYVYIPIMIIWVIIQLLSKKGAASSQSNFDVSESVESTSGLTLADITKLALAYSRNPAAFEGIGMEEKINSIPTSKTESSGPSGAKDTLIKTDDGSGEPMIEKDIFRKIMVNLSFAIIALVLLGYLNFTSWSRFESYKKTDIIKKYKKVKEKIVAVNTVVKKPISWRYQFLIDDIIEYRMDTYFNDRTNVSILKDLARIYRNDSGNLAKKEIRRQLKSLSLRWNRNDVYKQKENIGNIQKTIDELK